MKKLQDIKSLDEYDFIDLGAGDGASLVNNEKIIGGRGLGIELDKKKVKKAQEQNRNVVLGNALDLSKIPGKVRFITCDNFLEHLLDYAQVESIIKQTTEVATDFIYIRHPSFDDVDYLARLGLKTYWSDWTGHPSMLTVVDIVEILGKFGINWVNVSPVGKISDSKDRTILPLDAPKDQHDYEKKHGVKPKAKFKDNIFYAYDIVGLIKDTSKYLPTLTYEDRINQARHPRISGVYDEEPNNVPKSRLLEKMSRLFRQ